MKIHDENKYVYILNSILQRAHRRKNVDVNCVDSLGRGALTIAIDTENLEMVELLVIMSVETRDALLQAINAEFVEAVELLLEVIFVQVYAPYGKTNCILENTIFLPILA